MESLPQKLSDFSKTQLEKWEKLPLRQKTKVLAGALVVGFANLLYSLFTIYTIVSMGAIILAVLLLTKTRIDAVLERGLISFLPQKTKKNLLERSIFDVLCDAWFVPRLGLYIKAFAKPFIVKIQPEDAIHQFEDLPESSQRAILQKGIINTLPSSIRTILLPKAQQQKQRQPPLRLAYVANESSEEKESVEDQIPVHHTTVQLETAPQQRLQIKQFDESELKDGEITSSKDKNSMLSTDDEPRHTFRQRLASSKNWLDQSVVSSSNSSSRSCQSVDERAVVPNRFLKSKKKAFEFRVSQRFERSYFLDPFDGLSFRSEVISSSKMAPKATLSLPPSSSSHKWDNLDLFLKTNQEKIHRLASKPARKNAPLKGPLQVIDKITQLLHMSKHGFLAHLDDKILLKLFSLSSLALIVQFSLSKKTRYWLYNTLHILVYVVGIILSTGTLGVYAMKLKKAREGAQKKALAGQDPSSAHAHHHRQHAPHQHHHHHQQQDK